MSNPPILLYQVALRRHEELLAEAERERKSRMHARPRTPTIAPATPPQTEGQRTRGPSAPRGHEIERSWS